MTLVPAPTSWTSLAFGSLREALLALALAATACASWPPLGRRGPARAAPTAPPEPALVYDPPADLPAPEAVRATSGQYREIPLRWDPVLIPGVAGYVVEGAALRGGAVPRARHAARPRRAGVGRPR